MKIKLGIRGKLFLISLVVILIVGLISGAYLESRLKTWLQAKLEADLLAHARSAAYTVSIVEPIGGTAKSDEIADRLGEAMSVRVTIIQTDGTVIGDSDIPLDEIPDMQNHGDRPEVIEALGGNVGISQRYSSTLGTWMLYAAVPYEREDSEGVVRVAMPMREVDSAVGLLRRFVWFAGGIGLIIAVFMSFTASRFMSGRLRKLVDQAHAVTQGNKKPMLLDGSQDEISGLAGSINRLAENLEKVVAELADERDQLNAVVESIGDGIIALDNRLKITLINSSAVTLLNLPESPIGRSMMEAIRVPDLFELINKTSDSETALFEFEYFGEGRKILLARIAGSGTKDGKVVVLRDVTEVRQLETTRQDFLANASHELRTPVSVVQANVETLLSGALDDREKARHFLEAINRNTKRLTQLVDDLLQISRIEGSRTKLDLALTDLKQVAKWAVDAVSTLATSKSMTIAIEIEDGIQAQANERALEDVLINLLENAVKYTPENGNVIVRAEQDRNAIRIVVEDNGPGITPKHRDRIFERFYRVDPGRSREMGGTGLGLSIVKHLVTAMDGEVAYEPVSPHGSKFIITLSSVNKSG